MKNLFLSCKRDLIRELNHGGSLSSHNMVSCGIKLLRTLRTDLLKIHTFSLTCVFEKALSQLNSFNGLLMSSVFTSLKCRTSIAYGGWWVTYFQMKICKNNLMVTTWMKGRTITWFDYPVWLRRKNYVNTRGGILEIYA